MINKYAIKVCSSIIIWLGKKDSIISIQEEHNEL